MPPKRLSNRRSCAPCRRLHIKCDGEKPSCSPCQRSGRECNQVAYPFTFRDGHKKSASVLASTPKPQKEPGSTSKGDLGTSPIDSETLLARPPGRPFLFIHSTVDIAQEDSDDHRQQDASVSPVPPQLHSPGSADDAGGLISPGSISLSEPSQARLSPDSLPRLWPLRDRSEGMLICYFQNELSTWFDYCDQSRHFANQVVQAASKHRIIFYAITAVSARHLAILKKWDPLAADRYQAKCLQHFIPALANRDPALEGDFLCAVTLILRLYDEMTVPAGESPSGHVLDTGILIRSQNPEAKGYSLCQASLFVAIRQEIFICFKAQKVPPPLSQYLDDGSRTIDPADDFTWTRRIVAHTEDVLTFAYGSQSRSKERWAELKAYLDSWDQHRPSSFDAIWSSGDGEGGFPEMWFANDCHVSGQQYSDICHILLAVHDPHIPILGLDRLAACVSVDHLIRKLVRRICGIVLCDRRYLPAATVAGMAIAMCGDRFTDRSEQEKLLGILQGAEAHMTWSFLIAEDRLRSIWGI